ncbi:hypothetical protein CHCC14427_0320 [Bacillus paralicheniformis]|nr:hypothetical protein CHCC14427_0320 [Bacillus paralicheniformis]
MIKVSAIKIRHANKTFFALDWANTTNANPAVNAASQTKTLTAERLRLIFPPPSASFWKRAADISQQPVIYIFISFL